MSEKQNLHSILAGLVIVAAASSSHAQTATFDGLGQIPGEEPWGAAYGVSASGPVAVGRQKSHAQPGLISPYLWESGSLQVLTGVNGQPAAGIAHGISADGQVIVGWSASGPGGNETAFRWTAADGMTLIPGASDAFGVSADGSVIVGFTGTGAYRWTSATGAVTLAELPGGLVDSIAQAVSDDGNVVVGGSNSDHGYEAVRWTEAEGVVPLRDVVGANHYDRAYGVSADGSVIVGSILLPNGFYEAFRWTEATGLLGMGDLPGGTSSRAYGVSDDGSIIVGESFYNAAFIWTEEHGMLNLQQLLTSQLGLQLDDWTLRTAQAIATSDTTVYVAGNALNPSNEWEGYMVSFPKSALMPEPGCLAVLGLIPLILPRRRR